MAFDVNTITVQGAIAIASATAGNKLVIDGCDAVTGIYTQAQAVQIASRPATPDSTTTSIALAGSTENHVYAYASFIQGETGQPGGDVRSFLLYGHSENTPIVVVVVAVASSTDPVHLPESGDVTNRTEVQFELSFSATDEVVTVAGTSMYTTRGEFLLLKNRTVTTHAEGETTVGDDQDIYGDKTFKDNATFSTIDGEEIEIAGISVHAIKPATNGTILLGTPDSRFLSVATPVVLFGSNSTTGYGANCVGNAGTYDSQAGLKSGNSSNEAYIGCFSTQGVNETTHKAVMRCKPNSGNSTHCNITLTYNETADSSSVDVNAGSTAINGDVSVAGDLYVTGDLSVGPDSYAKIGNLAAFPDTNAIWLCNSILPDSSGLNIGNASHRFSRLCCDEIYGAASNQVVGYTGMLHLLGYDKDTDHYAEIKLLSQTATGDIYPSLQVDLNNETDGESCHLSFRDGTLHMYGTGGSAIGKNDDAIGCIYVNQLSSVTSPHTNDIELKCGLVPASGATVIIGAYSNRVNGVYTYSLYAPNLTVTSSGIEITGEIEIDSTIKCTDVSATLGTRADPFGAVYANYLNGCIPNPSNNTSDPPVGTIFFACVDMGRKE